MSTSGNFHFSEDLDNQYLEEFYQGDLERAVVMFDVFLQVIDAEVDKLESLAVAQDWNAFASQAHKIKPNFQMVGLREFSSKMKKFEGARDDEDLRKMISLQFNDVKKEFAQAKSLVIDELERLKRFSDL